MRHVHLVDTEVDLPRPIAGEQSLGNEGIEDPLARGDGVVWVEQSATMQRDADARAMRTACLAASLVRLIVDQCRR